MKYPDVLKKQQRTNKTKSGKYAHCVECGEMFKVKSINYMHCRECREEIMNLEDKPKMKINIMDNNRANIVIGKVHCGRYNISKMSIDDAVCEAYKVYSQFEKAVKEAKNGK